MTGIVKSVLDFLYEFTGNYGWSIILLTIAVRLIILPLNISSMKFARISKELNPKVDEIKKKFKGDQDKINQETLKLWKDNNVNPAAGCLPLLIQLPVLFAVIRALQLPDIFIETPIFLNLNLALPQSGNYAWDAGLQYLVLPILAVLTTHINQKMISAGNVQGNMKHMNLFMTVFFGWITLKFPAGIALYWVVGNVFSISQYYFFNKIYEPAVIGDGGTEKNAERSKER